MFCGTIAETAMFTISDSPEPLDVFFREPYCPSERVSFGTVGAPGVSGQTSEGSFGLTPSIIRATHAYIYTHKSYERMRRTSSMSQRSGIDSGVLEPTQLSDPDGRLCLL